MRLQFLTLCGLILVGVPQRAYPINPNFNPQWQVGDSWRVSFRVTLAREQKRASLQPATQRADVVYRYGVLSTAVENGRNVLKVLARPDQGGFSEWLLTFDADQLTLTSVEEVIPGGENIKHRNPINLDAWMAKLDEYHLMMIHDFPKIPDTNTNQNRTLNPAGSSTPGFKQNVTFAANRVDVVLRRTDPASNLVHRTSMRWETGKKWWSTASINLGNNVMISANLL